MMRDKVSESLKRRGEKGWLLLADVARGKLRRLWEWYVAWPWLSVAIVQFIKELGNREKAVLSRRPDRVSCYGEGFARAKIEGEILSKANEAWQTFAVYHNGLF